jgi:hypothetical protein
MITHSLKGNKTMKEDFNTSKGNTPFENGTTHPKSTLTVDVEKYQAFLDGADMTEEQKDEFLQALWSIIVSFVELGFGVHPVQAAGEKAAEFESNSMKYTFNLLSFEDSNPEKEKIDFSP